MQPCLPHTRGIEAPTFLIQRGEAPPSPTRTGPRTPSPQPPPSPPRARCSAKDAIRLPGVLATGRRQNHANLAAELAV